MSEYEQLTVEKKSPAYWEVTFGNPPINLIDYGTVFDLRKLIDTLNRDPEVRVVVFRSADPEYFLAHWDIVKDPSPLAALPPEPDGMSAWAGTLSRLGKVRALTISALRGRARGAGSEFALATDVRFASRENTVLGQFEVGVGAVPGGAPMAQLARLVGRGRALEILIGADDIDGDLAERYGYVNRSVPDAELDAFVDAFARRVAGFPKAAVLETKALVHQAVLPPDTEFTASSKAFEVSFGRPETQERGGLLVERGLQQRGEVELRLGQAVAELTPASEGEADSTAVASPS
jgi:enoyl-CoA hydratase/carnithine racemase